MKNNTNRQHNMCWTPLYGNRHYTEIDTNNVNKTYNVNKT